MEIFPVMTLDPEAMRVAMRSWTAGVTVVTSAHEGERYGMTVNSLSSISLNPAMITVSLQKNTHTHELVMKSHVFGVTILAQDQKDVSDLFAGRKPEVQDRFASVQTETLVTGSPLIVGGLTWLDCRVVQTFDTGSTTLVIAEVLSARSNGSGDPLVYHNREYYKVSKLD